MIIECNEINQTIEQLLITFRDCNKVKNSDLRKLVELVSAVNTCQNGGPNYDVTIQVTYNTPQVVTFPINSFHSYSLNVLSGSINYYGTTFPTGSSRSVEYTTLNQSELTFTVNPGSVVFFE